MMTSRSFAIHIPEEALVAYWREKYDWRDYEARLNRLPQFVVPINGIDLHFIHQPRNIGHWR